MAAAQAPPPPGKKSALSDAITGAASAAAPTGTSIVAKEATPPAGISARANTCELSGAGMPSGPGVTLGVQSRVGYSEEITHG